MIVSEKQIMQLQYLLQQFITVSSVMSVFGNNESMKKIFEESQNLLCTIANQQSENLMEIKDE